jgi:opacity protein-like surface antigen
MRYMLAILLVLGSAACAAAQDTSTEVFGFYQNYRNFDFKTGVSDLDLKKAALNGGGGGIAYNLAQWAALWVQLSFYETAEQPYLKIRAINELQGIRYQTRQYGPIRFYAKGGLGFSRYSVNASGSDLGSSTNFSFTYGAGAQFWMKRWLGLGLEASHLIMNLPQITDSPGREKWDSGLAITTSLAVRF